MQRGSFGHEQWLRSIDPDCRAAQERREQEQKALETKQAPAKPEFFVTMAAMKETLTTIAASIAPLPQRITALEKRLRTLESKQNGVTIAAQGVSIDGLAHMADVVSMLNQTLAQPVKPIYDSRGILIGARRVAGNALDTETKP